MAQKYKIYHEIGWDEHINQPKYEKLTTLKNEQAAIDFISSIDNVGKYGNMKLYTEVNGKVWVYNEQNNDWIWE